jgi:hypothetical protein
VTSTARVYASSKATGLIEFTTGDIDTFGQYLTLGFTARDGRYYPGHANAIAAYTGIGPGANPTADNALSFKRTIVFDHETSSTIYMNAPASVRMVTPVTSMLVAPGSNADKLKTQIGITNSVFQMVANPDLATYDAVSEAESGDANRVADAARMQAANVRVLAIMTALRTIAVGTTYTEAGLSLGDVRSGLSANEAIGSRCLTAAPNLFVFQRDRMSSVIQCYLTAVGSSQPTPPAYLQLSPAKIEAIAYLINGYAAAIPLQLATSAEKARWLLGINGYLHAMVGRVATDSSDATAQSVLALGAITPTINTETSRYAEAYPYNASGLYMPSPDFLVLVNTTTFRTSSQSLTSNDLVMSNDKVNTRGFDPAGNSVISVSVPTANVSQLSVSGDPLSTYTVTVLNGFKGVTFFDYVAKAVNGEERTTRVYVRAM